MDIMLWACEEFIQSLLSIKITPRISSKKLCNASYYYLTIVVLMTCSDTVSPMISMMCSNPELSLTTSSDVNLQ